MEGSSRAAVELTAKGEVDMATLLALAGQHGIEMLGPVPAETGHLRP